MEVGYQRFHDMPLLSVGSENHQILPRNRDIVDLNSSWSSFQRLQKIEFVKQKRQKSLGEGGGFSIPVRKSIKELSETPCYYLEFGPMYGTPQSTQSQALDIFQTSPQNCMKILFSCFFFTYSSYSLCISFRKIKFQLLGSFSVEHRVPKVGCFSKFSKYVFFLLLYYLL